MENKFQSINQSFVDFNYNLYLQKRFGINSCTRSKDHVILYNQKVLGDLTNYSDVSSPVADDRTLINDCKRITILENAGALWSEKECTTPSTQISQPVIIIPTPVSSIPPIEVKVGSAEAIAVGVIEGNTTIINNDYVNRYVEIFRGNTNLPSRDPETGDAFFTKILNSSTINLSSALVVNEWIKIKVIA